MENEKLINAWKKMCLKKNHTPIALVCVNAEGFPIVLSDHNSETLNKVFKHLAETSVIDEKTHLENQDN